MHYLDNAATTRVADEAAETAARVLREHFANPSSLYAAGARAEAIISAARETVAASLGVKTGEILFTGSGTEADNIAVQGALRARAAWGEHIVVSGFEHPAVQNAVSYMQKQGWRVTTVRPDAQGHLDLDAMVRAVGTKTALCACMHVNNEVGTIMDVARLAREVKAKNPRTAVHVDGVQAWGKVPLKLSATMIDSYAVSGHKIHAPKGVGALYLRRGFHIEPLILGGLQEYGMRPGTENTAYIAAMAKAVELLQADKTRAQRVRALSDRLWKGLAGIEGIVRNSPEDALPDVANFSVENIRSETMLHFLESRDVCVSSGSACSKGEASHTLNAMGLARSRVDGAVRVSFSGENTAEDVDALLAGLRDGIRALAKVRK
ncbi:MAG TPA: cysteine desulfurase [Candidatus Ruthenibacterium merdigallinarum]|nr:cysteine desulfurase [Candidatus Ruthenibacterium merdigallinarum]